MTSLLQVTSQGLYCSAGDFFVDPWRPVERAVVTHAHSDHARWGCDRYLVAAEGETVFRTRLGQQAQLKCLPYGESLDLNGVKVSLHPAGHILGSAQIRLEYRGEVWVVSGDYKTEPDSTCATFDPVTCHTFVTESTFGLPIYRWPSQQRVFEQINHWWRANQAAGKASLLMGYALGKSQRLLAGLDASIGPIYTHGAVEKLNKAYRSAGVMLPETQYVSEAPKNTDWSKAMIIAPPSTYGTPWTRKFRSLSAGFASGWMQIRGTRRRKSVDRGFVLSDHVDWPSLQATIQATQAERILVTHGYSAVVVRWLREHGFDADILETLYAGEGEDAADSTEDSPEETSK